MKTLTIILTVALLIALTAALAFSISKIYGVVEQLPAKGLSAAILNLKVNLAREVVL